MLDKIIGSVGGIGIWLVLVLLGALLIRDGYIMLFGNLLLNVISCLLGGILIVLPTLMLINFIINKEIY